MKKDGYVMTVYNGRSTHIGRVILNPSKDQIVDHINGNHLDNRRSNLRLCNKFESARNRSGWRNKKSSKYKGVFFDRERNSYRAIVFCEGIRWQSKRFKTQIEAARAYDLKAKELHGEFARVNNE